MTSSSLSFFFFVLLLMAAWWWVGCRKLAEEGYRRSAKKCKEKFENVHKYYKRTKESRAGRNDGKTYRFFTQLEALHGTAAGVVAAPSPVTSLARRRRRLWGVRRVRAPPSRRPRW